MSGDVRDRLAALLPLVEERKAHQIYRYSVHLPEAEAATLADTLDQAALDKAAVERVRAYRLNLSNTISGTWGRIDGEKVLNDLDRALDGEATP